MKTQKKILFFDIDGTLLTEAPSFVPESTKLALKKAREQGHLTFVNTGRTRYILPKEVQEIGFDGYVCGCGSQIYLHNELVHSSTIPHELCVETVKMAEKCQIAAIFEQSVGLLYNSNVQVSNPEAQRLVSALSARDIRQFDQEEAEHYTFDKFLVFFQPHSDVETFQNFCEKHFSHFAHDPHVWEITQKEYSKATGIEFLLKYFDLPMENSYAFGDSVNDLPMLKYAGNSIAMGNAMEEILPFCHYQTTDIREDGIYNAMKHFGLLG